MTAGAKTRRVDLSKNLSFNLVRFDLVLFLWDICSFFFSFALEFDVDFFLW